MLKKFKFYLKYICLLFCIYSVVKSQQYEKNTKVQAFNKTFDDLTKVCMDCGESSLVKRNFKKRVNKEELLKKKEKEMKTRMGKCNF